MARDSSPLVYSTDGSHQRMCSVCGHSPCTCGSAAEIMPGQTVLRVRLDKKGRGGKAVTVVFDLPPRPDYFATLLKQLKAHCGAGGALKDGCIEIQGDQRDKVQGYLERLGFKVRRAGG